MQKKLVVLFIIVLLAFLGLSVRLFFIGRDNGETYKRQVLSQQAYDSTTLPYRRGDILDANGSILATSQKVYSLVLDSKQLLEKEEYMEPTMAALQACFDLNITDVRRYATEHPESRYRVLAKELSYAQMQAFLDLKEEEVTDTEGNTYKRGELIQGIWFEDSYKRYYPGGTLACDVIGFVGGDNDGQYGLEEYYNETLKGTNGREYGFLNDESTLKRTIKPAVDGETIVTTIDSNVQAICEKYLKAFSDEHANEAREGLGANNIGCIVYEINTGNIVAMASYPNFDLNDPYNISAYYTEEQIAELQEEDELQDTIQRFWRNFCISDTYEPGSVIKPFTVAAALDDGSITGNETYNCTGVREIGGHKIRCHNRYGDGIISVKGAIETSCNVALTYIAETMGPTEFCRYQHAFNFGLRTNVDLAGEARTDSLVYTASTMGSAELATNSFGQTFNVTMIQMVAGFASLVNGGYYYEPHIVSKILNADGSVAQTISPRVLKRTISEEVSDTIIDYCNGVVEEGTGKRARPAGYRVGGKTGTAETLPRGNGEYVVSFMGYAPADNPQYIFYVVVDRANAKEQADAKFATGIARNIMTEALPYLNIFMTEELTEKEIAELEALNLSITNGYKEQLAAANGTDPENSEGTEGEGGEGENNGEGQNGETGGEAGGGDTGTGETVSTVNTQVWRTFELDPATGTFIDPETGHHIDPETGDDLDGTSTGEENP
jgi:stage V sporulation protein D (sporulation-specific penicillin-binding protein)